LDKGGLLTKTGRFGVAAVGVFVANPPIGHFFTPSLSGNAIIESFHKHCKPFDAAAAQEPEDRRELIALIKTAVGASIVGERSNKRRGSFTCVSKQKRWTISVEIAAAIDHASYTGSTA
jgi:hypothetical protein